MKLSAEQKAAHKAAFRNMTPAEKADYVFTYYKWPILLCLTAMIVLGSVVRHQLTKKDPVIYAALANVAVGEDMETALTGGYIAASGAGSRAEVYLYSGLYLSEDADTVNHEYSYASHIKVMGAIQTGKMDVILMNREAYDLCSRRGYLADLRELLAGAGPELAAVLEPVHTENDVIVSDNSLEYLLNEADEQEVILEPAVNAAEISGLPLFAGAGFDSEVYIGVIANSTRTDEVLKYLSYIAGILR